MVATLMSGSSTCCAHPASSATRARRWPRAGVIGANFTFGSYLIATRDALLMRDVTTGVVKSLVFGLVITAVGCQEGFSTGIGAEGVGRSTTSAVVVSILLVVLIDLVFTTLFYAARGVA